MPEVLIDGVRYVPVSEAHVTAPAIEDAVIGDWAGDNWRENYPDALGYIRILISDDTEGLTVPDFVARVLAEAEKHST